MRLVAGTLVAVFGFAGAAVSQDVVDIEFDSGAEGESIDGTVTGNKYIDYRFEGEKGQAVDVTLEGDATTYFNLLAPGSTDEAIFNGSVSGAEYSGTLPESGTYTVRVYQMGAAADGTQPNRFTVELGVN